MVLLAAMLAVAAMAVAVAAAPSLAQTSGGFPDYVLEEDGTVVIEGDMATDCPTFASGLEDGYFESGDISPGAQRVLEQCVEAGLLETGGGAIGAPANSSPKADEEGGGLPDTGGPDLPALLAVSGVLAIAVGLLARRIATV